MTKTYKPDSLSKSEYEKLSNFRFALRRFMKFSEEAAESNGLTAQQHQALLTIKGFPGRDHITNGELAEWLQIKHHSAVGLVNRLEAQNLISRERNDNDKREIHISLTPLGMEILEKLTTIHQKELKSVAPLLSNIFKSLNLKSN